MQKDTPRFLRKVFYDIFKDDLSKQAENLNFVKKCNDGIRHFAGRIDLTLQLSTRFMILNGSMPAL